jgi:hypothetical protein
MFFQSCSMTVAGQTTPLNACSFGPHDLPHQDATGDCPYLAMP